jgi:hypothetical protein
MRRKLLALFGATAVALVGAVAFAAGPAQAATPQAFKPWDVTFSDDDCSGKTVVTLVNDTDDIPHSDGIGLVFDVNGDPIAVSAGTTKTVEVTWPDSEDIDVHLTGIFETPELETAVKEKSVFEPVIEWHHSWKRPAGCWDVKVTQNCDATFTIAVTNTGPDQAKFGLQVDGSEIILQVVNAGATWTTNYTSGKSVTLILDRKARDPITFKEPECSTPSPTPVPTTSVPEVPGPVLNGPDLPTTGDSLTKPAVTGVAAIALGLLIVGSMLLKRRRTGAEVSTTEE